MVGVAGSVPVADLPGMQTVIEKHRPYMLASRESHPFASTVVIVGGVPIGAGRPVSFAGPAWWRAARPPGSA